MKNIIIILVVLSGAIFSQESVSSLSLAPGAFSRMGFGARGIGMGNSMSAVKEGNLVSYYNPALSVFQKGAAFSASYTFLSLGRSLNFLSFTKRFELKSKKDSSAQKRAAGISVGIINSGVSGIEGRDNQGIKTGDLKTSENQFFFSFSNRFSERLSFGLAAKFLYYKLYEKITSTGVGFDMGAVYSISDNLSFSAVISDLNSKYKWDTAVIRNEQGKSTKNSFPVSKRIGACYSIKNIGLLTSIEVESYSKDSNFLRLGLEYNIFDHLFIRGGIERLSLSNSDFPARPSLGFSFFKQSGNLTFGVDYAFVIEPYSPEDQHVVGIDLIF